ncbi:zinc finger CCCH-type with G patch domain-containing protein-like [Mercenaria mercenaria]|uniref:zinc finger CCCH-type with G patch domain-containing protein-like n=1 Tax=Mercenaria mercenaria TaxID=6596 RepID=UPI00234EF10F|nr:zinc finger CCCH-type with G patch domain-containing protein-like [Mercenaria mercenaria]
MEEEDLQTSIQTYQLQLSQVEQAIQAAGSTPDLEALQTDLQELIKLTQDSLLSLKKSKLLKQLDVDNGGQSESKHKTSDEGRQSEAGADNLDEEYAAFQAMLGNEISGEDRSIPNRGDNSSSYSHLVKEDKSIELSEIENPIESSRADNSDIIICPVQAMSDMYNEIVGTKCRAPYIHEWGAKTHGNALIAGVEKDSELEIPKVRVMFCNPTHMAMLPCKYFLGGSCRFSEGECRYSHGHVVPLEDLQEYQDPDYSMLKLESRCLARYDDDDLWYKATVVDLHDDGATVMFDDYDDKPLYLAFEDILPLANSSEASSDSDDDITDNQPISRQDSDEDDELPVFLWKPKSHGLGDLGQWEAHTKGIGSRLLTKMGYVPGQGLGKAGEGRIQPVPIQLLPQGKSLDKIMELKEIAGERDLFDVMKKQERKMKKQEEKLKKQYQVGKQYMPNMFDFINKKLHGKKGKLSELIHKHEGQSGQNRGQGQPRMHRTISEHDLKSKSDRNINIQLLKTSEEMKSVEKELVKLKQSLSRNENRDRNMASQVRQKIQSMERYLEQLKTSESTMQTHQQKRTDHKKLTIF